MIHPDVQYKKPRMKHDDAAKQKVIVLFLWG